MMKTVKLTEITQEQLCCPICHSKLLGESETLLCANSQCEAKFPIVDSIPVLINESSSIFSISDFIERQNTTFNITATSKIKRFLVNLVPQNSVNIQGVKNYQLLAELLLKQIDRPKVLVLGGSILGQGMEALTSVPSIDIIASDVSFGPQTALICDAHDIPFKDKSFDGVIAQAVLEHVVDPIRCVEEIHRVLKDNGLVYAETPFMQQVHMGRYDFTRFTHLGHRRLFRKFEEICSGVGCGSGMALSWAYQYFLLSFVKTKVAQAFVIALARITSFWLKYFDYYLVNKPGTFDGASAYYFLGKKSDTVLSDRDLIKLYKGIRGGISPEF